ncbi:MAG: helical backbone metal receptor [Myxococcota bacterium]|nr:helical backbone metal receptor [Myxococcota bacterium]
MYPITDATQYRISTPLPPKRIISLVPSISETVCHLASNRRLVGITRFCVHPKSALKGIRKIGGTKNPDIQTIRELNPDLVLANAEENTKEIFDEIRAHRIPLHVGFPKSVDTALEDLRNVGTLLHEPKRAQEVYDNIQLLRAKRWKPFRYVYLIWNKPLMAISSDCFISSLLAEIGGVNLIKATDTRYPNVSKEMLSHLPVDCVFLSSEPYPFKEKHRQLLCSSLHMPIERFQCIDGEFCSWHGVRMLPGLQYLQNWRSQQCF